MMDSPLTKMYSYSIQYIIDTALQQGIGTLNAGAKISWHKAGCMYCLIYPQVVVKKINYLHLIQSDRIFHNMNTMKHVNSIRLGPQRPRLSLRSLHRRCSARVVMSSSAGDDPHQVGLVDAYVNLDSCFFDINVSMKE